jgi:peroxiredoxin
LSADRNAEGLQVSTPADSLPGETLAERLAAFRAEFETGGNAASWIHETMRRGTAELIDSGHAERALKAGAVGPSFTLADSNGLRVSSADLLRRGPLIITFYRGVWCPYCNVDLQAVQATLPSFEVRGANVVAVSPQTAANSRRSQRENKLSFPILSDPGNEVAALFGLRFKLQQYLIDLYKDAFKNNLDVVNGDASWTLPMPARYVIAQDGVIAYAEVNPDYTRRPDPSELLPVLDRLLR